ncbi:universal stress protein [Streptomyces sp. NPDC003635]
MELPLVVGVDGSADGLQAVDWAVAEAARHGLPLRLVYASLWERYEGEAPGGDPGRPSDQKLAEDIVTTAAERARRLDPAARVSVEVVPDEATHALLGEAHHAFAVVTGSRGRGGLAGLLLGSVSLTVAARAHGPVIVVRGDRAGLAGTHGRILLGAADPAVAGEATRFAFREAAARGCVLDVVRAWRHPARATTAGEHEERASALLDCLLHEPMADHAGTRLRRATVEGPARRVLLDRSAAADLVIIGARHRSGHFGLQLGRVAHTLLHHAHCPVAVVPQPE